MAISKAQLAKINAAMYVILDAVHRHRHRIASVVNSRGRLRDVERAVYGNDTKDSTSVANHAIPPNQEVGENSPSGKGGGTGRMRSSRRSTSQETYRTVHEGSTKRSTSVGDDPGEFGESPRRFGSAKAKTSAMGKNQSPARQGRGRNAGDRRRAPRRSGKIVDKRTDPTEGIRSGGNPRAMEDRNACESIDHSAEGGEIEEWGTDYDGDDDKAGDGGCNGGGDAVDDGGDDDDGDDDDDEATGDPHHKVVTVGGVRLKVGVHEGNTLEQQQKVRSYAATEGAFDVMCMTSATWSCSGISTGERGPRLLFNTCFRTYFRALYFKHLYYVRGLSPLVILFLLTRSSTASIGGAPKSSSALAHRTGVLLNIRLTW